MVRVEASDPPAAVTPRALIALLDPGLIIVGGGLSQSHEWIFEPAVRKTVAGATFHRLPPIVPAALSVWAGAWGATIVAESAIRR